MILLFSNFKFAMKKKLRIVKDECSFDVDKFKYSSQKKFLT